MAKKIFSSIFLPLIIFFLLNSCEKIYSEYTTTRFAMGTTIQITVIAKNKEIANKAFDAAFSEISRIGSLFYEKNPESPLFKFSHRKTKSLKIIPEVLDLIYRGYQISEKTDGAFDMTIGALLPLYNFKEDNPKPPSKNKIDSLLQFVNYKQLKIDRHQSILSSNSMHTMLATGAIAKGYSVDRAIKILAEMNLAGAIVNAGGDLRVLPRKDGEKWKIGIQDPRDRSKILKIIEISEGATTTSGDYEKFFLADGKRIHHIIDPKTGYPAYLCQSVTIIAPTTELADALATSLFVTGPTKGQKILRKFPNCSALWVTANGDIISSQNFDKYLNK